jgi:hypothetical protein
MMVLPKQIRRVMPDILNGNNHANAELQNGPLHRPQNYLYLNIWIPSRRGIWKSFSTEYCSESSNTSTAHYERLPDHNYGIKKNA